MDELDRTNFQETTTALIESINNAIQTGTSINPEDILKSPLDNSGIHRKLMNIWDRRTIPKYNMVSYRSFFKSACREIRLVNNERKVNAQRNNITNDELELDDDIGKEKEKTIENDGMCIGLHPFTGEYTIKLVHHREVQYSQYQKFIKYYGNSLTVALPTTIEALMTEADRRGLSARQVAELYIAFAREKFPSTATPMQERYSRENYRDVYECLVTRIDIKDERSKINEALRGVVRKPHESIINASQSLESLLMQSLGITNPNMSEKERKENARQFILYNLIHFVSHETAKKYNQYLEKAQGMKPVTLKDAVAEIQRIEGLHERYAIQSEKRFSQNISILQVYCKAGDETKANINNIFRRGSRERSRDRSRGRTRTKKQPGKDSRPSSGASSRSSSRSASRNSSRSHSEVHAISTSSNKSSNNDKTISRRSDKSPIADIVCYKCGSKGHMAANCFRYGSETKYPCSSCKKDGKFLLHDTNNCRFPRPGERSNYRSPTPTTREFFKNKAEQKQNYTSRYPKNEDWQKK